MSGPGLPLRDGYDLLVIGSGVAGLTAALRAQDVAPGLRVAVVAKGDLSASATAWAQGGVAAVLDDSEVTLDARVGGDSASLHVADTLAAGAGLCDRAAVEVLTSSGPGCVRHLVELGASFDRDTAGVLELAREGGHSVARVVHAGGAATGAEVQRCLVEAVRGSGAELWEGTFATDLIVEGGRCRGVRALAGDGADIELRATHTLLATGGAGQLFSVTTNPATSTADGIAMAARAGVAVADVEFVQFHPTALHHPVMPRPLLSEALRGEGALLLDPGGQRFVDELSPRDVVSRAMTERMLAAGADHVWLDARQVPELADRFATLVAAVAAAGFDPTRELLPVAPAAHYLCGGVLTDLDGATALPGLWAAGEVACTGVHGANRLASNSLLEGLVFATRAVAAIVTGAEGPTATGALGPWLDGRVPDGSIGVQPGAPRPQRPAAGGPAAADTAVANTAVADTADTRTALQRAMSAGAGVVRSAESLAHTRRVIVDLATAADGPEARATAGGWELANLFTIAHVLLDAAEAREETRGCHSRSDHPALSDSWRHRLVEGRRGDGQGHVSWLDPPLTAVRDVVARALAEDLGVFGDLTAGFVAPGATVAAAIVARADGVLAGRSAASEVFATVDPAIAVGWQLSDGDRLGPGTIIATVDGPLAPVLTSERTVLNLLGHLSGVATLTRRFVDAAGPTMGVRDTRKTTPGLRALEKAAVRAGGGINHRASLSEGILVKDNHLAGLTIPEAVTLAKKRWPGQACEVECDTLDQVRLAVDAGADMILLDNMSPAEVEDAIELVGKGVSGRRVPVEVSGRVTLETIAAYAAAGADLVAVGALTHSAPVLDIGLDLSRDA